MEYVNDNKTLGISKKWHSSTPPPTFAGNQNMKNIMEKGNWQNICMGGVVMGKCKDKQKKSCITKTNCKHSEKGYGRLQLGDVYTCHGFLQRMCKFEEVDSRIFFHKFIQWLVDKGIGNQLSIEFIKPQKQLYAILSKQAYVPQEFRNKVLKHLVNC